MIANAISNWMARLPRPTLSRSGALLGVYTLVLFLLFLALTFPHELIARRLARNIGNTADLRIRFERVRLVPWAGYRFSELRLLPRNGDTEIISARSLDLRPTLAAIIRGSAAAVVLDAELYGGELAGTIDQRAPGKIDFEWSGIDLGIVPAVQGLVAGAWAGSLSGNLKATTGVDLREIDGEGKLTLRDASLTGGTRDGFMIPDLTKFTGDASFTLRNGRAEITSVKLTGDQVEIDVRGQIVLATPLPRSRLSGSITAKAMPENPGIAGLLRFAAGGRAPVAGAYKFTLSGSLERPRIR